MPGRGLPARRTGRRTCLRLPYRGSLPGNGRAPPPGPEACDGPGPAASFMTVPGLGPARRLAMTTAETGSGNSVLEEAARELEAAGHRGRGGVGCLVLGW